MAVIVIPARYGSTRFPGKPLYEIAGKAMVVRVWERCVRSRLGGRVIVATDDERVAEVCRQAGAEVAMTSRKHPSGTDRVAEVARMLKRESIFINVQGDEPEIDPRLIDRLIHVLQVERKVSVVTAAAPIPNSEEFLSPHVVKVVCDRFGDALYFSRSPIPFVRDVEEICKPLRHHGIYGFRRNFLMEFTKMRVGKLERIEKLEQLRILESGFKVRVISTKSTPHGVDTIEQARELELRLAGGK